MNEIIRKCELGPGVVRMTVSAPKLARKARAGQFVILRVTDSGERFPLTIADADPAAGAIDLIFQVVGKSTLLLSAMEPGQAILDLVGPLGLATEIERYGRVLCVGGGIGVAPLYPIAKALKAAGNTVVAVLGARSKDLLIMEEEFRAAADEVYISTDDGTYGRKGLVTSVIRELLEAGQKFDKAWVIGPVPMMRAASKFVRTAGVPTLVSLNPIMVDGTGMCGGCRVIVGGQVKFACVDGPEFPGDLVDFDSLSRRLGIYRQDERHDMDACKIGLDDKAK
jgi:ferredoxin/flavodoxin---NADP+ reductase